MKKQVNNMKKLLIATALLGSSAGMVFVNTGVSYAANSGSISLASETNKTQWSRPGLYNNTSGVCLNEPNTGDNSGVYTGDELELLFGKTDKQYDYIDLDENNIDIKWYRSKYSNSFDYTNLDDYDSKTGLERIDGATGKKYTIQAADYGKYIGAVAVDRTTGKAYKTKCTQKVNANITGAHIDGPYTVGSKIRVSTSPLDVGGTVSSTEDPTNPNALLKNFQWYRTTDKSIEGEKISGTRGQTAYLTVSSLDIGYYYYCTFDVPTGVKCSIPQKVYTDDRVRGRELTGIEITSDLKVGSKPTAKVTPTEANEYSDYYVHWYVSEDGKRTDYSFGDDLNCSTAIPSSAEGKYIIAEAEGKGKYDGSRIQTVSKTRVVPDNADITSAHISGTFARGNTVVVDRVEPSGYKYTVKWYSSDDGTTLGTELGTEKAFNIPEDSTYKYLIAVVKGAEGYTGEVTLSNKITDKNTLKSATITGSLIVGKQLNVSTTPFTNEAESSMYWYISDDGNTQGEWIGSGMNITIPDKALNKYIMVVVTGGGQYNGTVKAVTDDRIGQLKTIKSASITGDVTAHSRLDISIDPSGATANTNWYISNNGETLDDQIGAGAYVYVPDRAIGKYIVAEVTGYGDYTGTVKAKTTDVVKQEITSVNINGDTTVGSQVYPNVNPSGATYTAEWYVSDTRDYLETLVGTTSTGEPFTVPAAAKGKYLMVKVTGTGNYGGTKTGSTWSKVNSIDSAGIMNFGLNQKASLYVNPDGATYNVEWFLSDNDDTSNEANLGTSLGTSQTVLVTNDFVNKYLKAKVTGTGDYEGIVFTASEQIGKLSYVDIEGHYNVGETLKASVYPEAATFEATWYHADEEGNKTGDPIGTGSNYTLKESDLGAHIYVEATGTGNYSGTVNTCRTWETVEAALKKVTSYNFVKKNKVGETMEFTYLPADATLMMYWERQDTNSEKGDDTNVTLAEDVSQYTIKEADKGKYIRLSVNGKGDYKSFEYTSGWIKILDDDITITKELTSASITGELTVGKNISLKVEPTDATYNVNWYISDDGVKISDGTPIGTGNNLTIPEKALGKYIIGEASGTGDYNGSVKKAASAVVVKANTDVTQQVLITLINDKATTEDLQRQEINIDKNGTLNLDNYKPSNVEGFVFKGWEDAATGKIVTGKITASDSGKYIAKWEPADTDTKPGNRIPNSKENVEYTEIDTDKVFNGHKQGVKVYVSQGQDIAVQLPFKAVLDGKKGVRNKADFKVQVRANIAGDDNVKVIPESAFTMTTPGKNDINGTVTVDQTEFNIKKDTEEALATGKIINGTVEAFNVSAGHWEGGFSWTISVEGMKIDNSTENTEDIVVTPGN